ncbi:hypothetical protein [Chitinophaga sancti]|uniref:Histidine kinase-, DNA gyrase B-, and HSP90-like ATPase n=1 Tax=Chitinophaga sancti TaxID=1004 RepID=A0A1K1N9Z6_9BACT|nr:hypothetical protein [Chitinophaga sancti]WQD63430.1 hypothetical protein U0033_03405 [Chitinophaga sancti]WQG90944.1 hypothetical protein SR876_05510 [Chitinophaga sancti]SFW32151.1 hypothetical protein SAMN05661012_01093 [Chitinophaga sancti]
MVLVSCRGTESFYCIRIPDNGIGFGPGYNEKIFDIFYKRHDRNTYAGAGTAWLSVRKLRKTTGALSLPAEKPAEVSLSGGIYLLHKIGFHRAIGVR